MVQPVTENHQPKRAHRFRVLRWVAVLVFVIALLVALRLRNSEPLPIVVQSPVTPITHNPWPDRWIPRSWGWMWRLRDSVFGPRTTVNLQAQVLRFAEPAMLGQLNDLPPPTLATNGLRLWTLNPSDFENTSAFFRGTNQLKSHMFSPRITTADGIVASAFSGHSVPLAGGSTEVGFRFQVLPLTRKRKTELTLNVKWTEVMERQSADASTNGPTLRTNLWQTIRAQVPLGHGFLLMQPPGDDQPGAILLLSIGRK
jgi:hypothetical protein